jgi:hypothetical protein
MKRAAVVITLFGLMTIGLSRAQAPSPGSSVAPQSIVSQAAFSFDQLIDRSIVQENNLLKILRGEHPLAETYIQDLEKDSESAVVLKSDHYFLGKLDFKKGVSTSSYLPRSDSKKHALDAFTHLFSIKYLPRGFAQMMLIDGSEFDRGHYNFEFLRREFLGDVRTYVVTVTPKKEAGLGRFIGRIWVEDKTFNIVRFNGTYGPHKGNQFYMHFDSWRVNCGPDLWVPYQIYSEESAMPYAVGLRKLRFKALTQVWGYTTAEENNQGEFTNMVVETPSVEDKSAQAADNSPIESLRAWERQGEDNILNRMEQAGILSPRGEVEKVLETVITNLIVTNNLTIVPEVRTRVILTAPLETFTVGHTIVISRGLLDTLPDEPSLAAVLAHELAHIALGQEIDTKFAFADRVLFADEATLKKFRFARSQSEEDAANEKAVELLQKSPYKDKLGQAGLFLKALGAEGDRLPSLIKPLFGSQMARGNNVLRLASLLQSSPELQPAKLDQIAALPLGARTKLDPWTDHLQMVHSRPVPVLVAREKLPFGLTPVYLHLTYKGQEEEMKVQQPQGAPDNAAPPAASAENKFAPEPR